MKELDASVIPSQIRTVPSPVNPEKVYQELNVLYADSIDFGTSLNETSMMRMKTVTAPGLVQMSLDLGRKNICINFPLTVDGRRSKFRFELPMQLLQHMHRVDDIRAKQSSFIIPFGSAPRFFKFAEGDELSATFSPSDRTWYEGHGWIRQTDIVDGRTLSKMATMPVMHMKNVPIIDIGTHLYLIREKPAH
jgi:RNA-dependent RNA polymerase